jgi:hypothetical protein
MSSSASVGEYSRRKMIPIILSILGSTFIYAGVLTFPRDSSAGIVCALVGLLMIAKPSWDVFKRFRALSGSASKTGHPDRGRGKKRHLKVVKTEDKRKPTIH